MKKETIREIVEWSACIIIAVVLALTIKFYVGTPTLVKHTSMYPTLKPNERLILNRMVRTSKKMPNRGDIITFEAPTTNFLTTEEFEESVIARYENQPEGLWGKFSYYVLEINKISYIKRVIGLPGEHVKIENGKVYINGQELDESAYLSKDVVTGSGDGVCLDLVVPDNCIFAMGDNRGKSTDCRAFGCVPLDKIESKVWIRIWPINKIGNI